MVTLRTTALLTLSCALLFGCRGPTRSATQPPQLERAQVAPKHLGTVLFATSCAPVAKADFERGVALTHHMAYEPAEAAFVSAALRDPRCAIAHWGIAMTQLHPAWADQPDAAALAKGKAAIARARALSADASFRERTFIEAAAAYYEYADRLDHKARLLAFESAMARVHLKYPDDVEAAAFHALALLGTIDPSDKTYSRQRQAGRIAEEVAARVPDHPGALSYVIHAYDYPGLAQRAVEAARRYGRVAPENPYALHVPTHVFTRLGMWQDSIAANLRSAEAAEKPSVGPTLSLHLAHALDYVEYAYLQGAEDGRAEEVVRRVATASKPWQDEMISAHALAAIPARFALERDAWKDAARLEPRKPEGFAWDRHPAAEAISHFARGIGAARSGDVEGARAEWRALALLHGRLSSAGNVYWAEQVDIQRLSVIAWLARAERRDDDAFAAMRDAAAAEAATEKHPVTPGDVLPAGELLGDLLLELGRPREALANYVHALERSPNRFRSLAGAARAAELAGNPDVARRYHRQLVGICARADAERPALARARAVVGAPP